MAHFFALLLAVLQAPAGPPLVSLDARWVASFETLPAAVPGFDATTAYVPLKGGQLVAVDLNRGTIRWRLDVATAFTPATGEGLVFTVSDQFIEARDAANRRHEMANAACPAAPRRRSIGTRAGCWPRRRRAISRRFAPRTARWSGGGNLARPCLAPPGRRSIACSCRSPTTARRGAAGERAKPCGSENSTAPVTALLALDDQLVFGTAGEGGDERRPETRPRPLDLGTRRRHRRQFRPPTTSTSISRRATTSLRAVDRKSGNFEWKAGLASRPAGGPLRLNESLLMPLVSSKIMGFDPDDRQSRT